MYAQCRVCMHNGMYVCMPSWAPGMHNVVYVCTKFSKTGKNSNESQTLNSPIRYTCTIVHSTPVDRYCHTHIVFIYTQYNTQYNYIDSIHSKYQRYVCVLKKANRTTSGVVYDGIWSAARQYFKGSGQWLI